jgi:hypothetical protein
MARTESVIGITEGSGKSFHTISTSIGGTTKEDQVVILGEAFRSSYTALVTASAVTPSAAHMIAIEADGTNYIYITRMSMDQVVMAGAATKMQMAGFRTTTAGSGGTSVTARPLDTATSAFGGLIRSIGTKGTEGVQLLQARIDLLATQPTVALNRPIWTWEADKITGPIKVGNATTDGFVLKVVTGIATATVDISVDFYTLSY